MTAVDALRTLGLQGTIFVIATITVSLLCAFSGIQVAHSVASGDIAAATANLHRLAYALLGFPFCFVMALILDPGLDDS